MGQVTHTSTLPDRPISQSDPKKLHPSIRARPRIMPVVAAMRAPPRHCRRNLKKQLKKAEVRRKPQENDGVAMNRILLQDPREPGICSFGWGVVFSYAVFPKPKLLCVDTDIDIDIEREKVP